MAKKKQIAEGAELNMVRVCANYACRIGSEKMAVEKGEEFDLPEDEALELKDAGTVTIIETEVVSEAA
jgi:hypothetical protein